MEMTELRVRDFPEDLLEDAKFEGSIDGDTLRGFATEAFRRELERRRAIPMDERRRLRLERKKP
jgi:hypothetical protein